MSDLKNNINFEKTGSNLKTKVNHQSQVTNFEICEILDIVNVRIDTTIESIACIQPKQVHRKMCMTLRFKVNFSSSSSSYSFNVRDPKTHTVFQASALARIGPPVIFLQAQRSCAISSFIPIAFMSLLTQLLHVFLGAPLSTTPITIRELFPHYLYSWPRKFQNRYKDHVSMMFTTKNAEAHTQMCLTFILNFNYQGLVTDFRFSKIFDELTL